MKCIPTPTDAPQQEFFITGLGSAVALLVRWQINGWVYKSEHWFCELLGGLLSALPLKSRLVSTVLGP